MPVSPPICMMASDVPQSDANADTEAGEVKHAEKGDDDSMAVAAKGLPDVDQPTPAEVAQHCLTHLPYRRWCKWCVAARMRNLPHWRRPPFSRESPLLVFDYCFFKHANDEHWLTVLVGRLYPARTIFAAPCHQKGADPYVTRRLAAFLRACGVTNFSYMCDQESACRTMVDEAISVTKGRG